MPHDEVSYNREDYKPREYSTADHIAIGRHARVIAEATDRVGNITLTDWRRRLVGKLEAHTSCDHARQLIVDVPNEHGIWAVQICVACGEQTKKVCHHIRSDWNETGTVLICGNCGIDGT